MHTVIYIDYIIIINLVINYLLLFATAKVVDLPLRRLRFFLSAMLGSGYAVLVLFEQFSWMIGVVGKLACAAVMLLVAFGSLSGKLLLRASVVFALISAMMAGCVLAIGLLSGAPPGATGLIYLSLDMKTLLLTTLLSFTVISLCMRRTGRKKVGGTTQVTICWGKRELELTALVDSGHSLTDPFTGAEVVVVELDAIWQVLPADLYQYLTPTALSDPSELISALGSTEHMGRLRLLPFKALGTPSGLLLGLRPDKVYINKKHRKNAIIALSSVSVSDGMGHTALVSAN